MTSPVNSPASACNAEASPNITRYKTKPRSASIEASTMVTGICTCFFPSKNAIVAGYAPPASDPATSTPVSIWSITSGTPFRSTTTAV